MGTIALYFAADGGHFATETVKVRKAPIDPDKRKDFRFVPLAANGTDRVKLARYILTDSDFAAWGAEPDADKRAALLVSPLEMASNISPTRSQVRGMRAIWSREQLAANLAAGILAIPSDRAERAAGTSASKAAMTEAERTAAALDALFADAEPVADATDDDASEGEGEGEPVADAGADGIAPTVLALADPTPDDAEVEPVKPVKPAKG